MFSVYSHCVRKKICLMSILLFTTYCGSITKRRELLGGKISRLIDFHFCLLVAILKKITVTLMKIS